MGWNEGESIMTQFKLWGELFLLVLEERFAHPPPKSHFNLLVYISQWIVFSSVVSYLLSIGCFLFLFGFSDPRESSFVWFPSACECEEVFELACAVVRLCVSCSCCASLTGIAPNITAGPSDSTVIDGMSVILHCETSGAPRPAITWQKGEEHILHCLHSHFWRTTTKCQLPGCTSPQCLSVLPALAGYFLPLYCNVTLTCYTVLISSGMKMIWRATIICKIIMFSFWNKIALLTPLADYLACSKEKLTSF